MWFDHTHPSERGYGYVGASRFRSKNCIYLFGKVRRTDWLPVRPKAEHHLDDAIRGDQSESDCDSEDDDLGLRSAMDRHQAWVKRGARMDDYGTDTDDSSSEDTLDSEDYAAREADDAAQEAYFYGLRALH